MSPTLVRRSAGEANEFTSLSISPARLSARIAFATAYARTKAQRKGKFCVASLKEARDKLEATARRIRTEWVQA